MELKHDIYIPDLSNIRQKEVVMYKDIDNNYNAFVKKLKYFFHFNYNYLF